MRAQSIVKSILCLCLLLVLLLSSSLPGDYPVLGYARVGSFKERSLFELIRLLKAERYRDDGRHVTVFAELEEGRYGKIRIVFDNPVEFDYLVVGEELHLSNVKGVTVKAPYLPGSLPLERAVLKMVSPETLQIDAQLKFLFVEISRSLTIKLKK